MNYKAEFQALLFVVCISRANIANEPILPGQGEIGLFSKKKEKYVWIRRQYFGIM